MTESQNLAMRIEALEREVAHLQETVEQLRMQLSSAPLRPVAWPPEGPAAPPVAAAAAIPAEPAVSGIPPVFITPHSDAAGPRKMQSPGKWDALRQEGLENLIGGRLLNRLGIIVLLFAAGYFLKFSFDNNWIGPAGRIIIGYIAGIAFLAGGHYLMHRGYQYFSQGFSGGAIGIIYLTTFFAVGSCHLIDRPAAFAILVITALAAGVLAVRQSAYGVALLASIGGFMAPFLIGRAEPSTAALFTYIAILDLGVLFLARFKNWRSLNMLALIATIAVYWIYYASLPWDYQAETLIFQAFATLFFLIFSALAFYYNISHGEKTRAADVILLIVNAGAYFIASYVNLEADYHAWLGPLAIVLAAFYLAVSLAVKKQGRGDDLLHIVMLGTGLAFVTAAIPLQLHEKWIVAAWLAEAAAVVYAGIRGRRTGLRTVGLLFLTLASLVVFADSPHYMDVYYMDVYNGQQTGIYYDQSHLFELTPVFNYYFLTMLLAAAGMFTAAFLYRNSEGLHRMERRLVWPLAVIGAIYALMMLNTEVSYTLLYFRSSLSADFAVSTSWAVFAIAVMTLGMLKGSKGIRFLALGLLGIITAKVLLFDLSGLPMVLRVLILLIVGAILVAVSFVYQRRSKGDISANEE